MAVRFNTATHPTQAARYRQARERDLRADSSFAKAFEALADIEEKCETIDAHLEESGDSIILKPVEEGDEDSLVTEISSLQVHLRSIPEE